MQTLGNQAVKPCQPRHDSFGELRKGRTGAAPSHLVIVSMGSLGHGAFPSWQSLSCQQMALQHTHGLQWPVWILALFTLCAGCFEYSRAAPFSSRRPKSI